MDATSRLLLAGFHHIIREPNAEMAFERFAAIDGGSISYDAFLDAVGSCRRDGLIREPIRLPEGALQCHWHLELTPQGVAAARAIAQARPDAPRAQGPCAAC